jgi:hypothetical protein
LFLTAAVRLMAAHNSSGGLCQLAIEPCSVKRVAMIIETKGEIILSKRMSEN